MKDDEAFIEELQDQVRQYKVQLEQAQEKVKSLLDQLERRKKENEMLKKTLQRNRPPSITPSFHKVGTSNGPVAGTSTAQSIIIEPAPNLKGSRKGPISPARDAPAPTSDSKLLNIAQSLKAKCCYCV